FFTIYSCFSYAIKKTGIDCEKLLMIGDNFEKDILGAIDSNVFAFHYDPMYLEIKLHKNYVEFGDFNDLHRMFLDIETGINNLTNLSTYCGQRFDLVQAGGGNVSVKTNNVLLIKSSGIHLGNVNKISGYSVINNEALNNNMKCM